MTKSRLALVLLALALVAGLSYVSTAHGVQWAQPTAPVTTQVASATGAASALTATITGSSGRMTYLEGFDVTGGGATAASVVNITVTCTTNTLNYNMAVIAGATLDQGVNRLTVRFPTPIPASATNTNIVVNVPSFGTGNTNAAVTAYGFTQ